MLPFSNEYCKPNCVGAPFTAVSTLISSQSLLPEHESSKEALRKSLGLFRKSLSDAEHAARSNAIAQKLLSLVPADFRGFLLAYQPINKVNEVDIRSFMATVDREGVTLAFPVVTHFSRKADVAKERAAGISRIEIRMLGRATDPGDYLQPNKWGILEPVDCNVISPDEIGLAVIPALGADRSGNRLGNGFGYYDELLGQLNCPLICPIFHECVLDYIPHDAHDRQVDYLVTENEIIEADTAL